MFLVVFGVRVTAYALSLITSFLFSVSLSVPLRLVYKCFVLYVNGNKRNAKGVRCFPHPRRLPSAPLHGHGHLVTRLL
jgi:hypothetical protein